MFTNLNLLKYKSKPLCIIEMEALNHWEIITKNQDNEELLLSSFDALYTIFDIEKSPEEAIQRIMSIQKELDLVFKDEEKVESSETDIDAFYIIASVPHRILKHGLASCYKYKQIKDEIYTYKEFRMYHIIETAATIAIPMDEEGLDKRAENVKNFTESFFKFKDNKKKNIKESSEKQPPRFPDKISIINMDTTTIKPLEQLRGN